MQHRAPWNPLPTSRGTARPEVASFQTPFPTILWPGSSCHSTLVPSPACCPLHVDLRNSGGQVSDMAETQGCSFHGEVDRTHGLPFILSSAVAL